MEYILRQFLLILGVSTNLLSGYPLLFQQDGLNSLSNYQNLLYQQQQMQQLLRMANGNSQLPFYTVNPNMYSLKTVPNLRQTIPITQVVGILTDPAAPVDTTTVISDVPVGAVLPTDANPVLNPVSACSGSGVLGNPLLSSVCCSLLGALSPCSLLGLGGLTGLGGLGGLGGLPTLPLSSLLIPNSLTGLGNLAGIGGCACNGLSLPTSPCCNPLPSIPNTNNIIMIPYPIPLGLPGTQN